MPLLRHLPLSPSLLRTLAAGLVAFGTVHAQAPAGSPAPVSPVAGDTAPGNGDANIKVNFINTPIMAIIPVYQQITGKKMILDAQLQGETLKIVGLHPMTKKEAVGFIEASLLLNGYSIIDKDPETVVLINTNGGKSPTSAGLPVFSSIRDLPDSDKVVHFVLPLQNISPDEATKAFTTVIKLHAYGAITPVNNTSNVIITENSATVRSIYELAQVIDVPPAESATELIDLKRSDAEKVADIVKEIYEEKEKADATPKYRGVQGAANASPAVPGAPIPNAAVAAAAGANNATNPSAAKVRIIPDRRTNSLLVIARPVDIAYIKTLVEKLDREAGDNNYLERKLRYMPVSEFLGVAKDALSRDTDISNDSGTSGGAGGNTKAGRSSRSRRTGGSTNTPSTDNYQAQRSNGYNQYGGINGQSGSSMGGGTSHTSLGDPEMSGAPESVVVGKTLLIADSRSNTLIVNGSPEHVQIIDRLIERMDLRPQQIYISTIIAQVNLGKQYDVGFDALKLLDDFSVRQGRTLSTSTTGTDTTGTTTTPGSTTGGTTTAAASGVLDIPIKFSGYNWNKLNLYGQIGALSNYVHLLEGDKNFKLLSRPSFYLRNNEKAVISSGQRIAVPVSTLSNVGAGIGNTASVSSSIEYRDVVLKMEVIPLINSNDEVTLQIAQVNDNVVGQQTVGGNSVPTIGTEELQTTVTVKNGTTVVLGGLITEKVSNTENGVVFLRRIPIIKHLFNTTEKQKDREETLIFIQPSIIKSTDPLDMPNTIEAGRSKVLDEGLRFSTERPEVRRAVPAAY